MRKWQDRLNGLQQRVAGGCNLNRDIPAILEEGGMAVAKLETFYGRREPKPYAFLYEAVATPSQ